jgi:hypothetical protein
MTRTCTSKITRLGRDNYFLMICKLADAYHITVYQPEVLREKSPKELKMIYQELRLQIGHKPQFGYGHVNEKRRITGLQGNF